VDAHHHVHTHERSTSTYISNGDAHVDERPQEPTRYSAVNRTKAAPMVEPNDDDMEYEEILAAAKRMVAERRRDAQRVSSESIPIPTRPPQSKMQRPSEASRYLQHTQTTTHQQFTQRVIPKSTNEEFIWL
jgi:hypothetical protein